MTDIETGINPDAGKVPGDRGGSGRKYMDDRRLSRFYSNLAFFLQSGLTIERCLDTMKMGKKGPFFWLLDGLQHVVMQGELFWKAVAQFPRYFDPFQAMIIRSAEESGRLVELLRKLSGYYEMRYLERRRFMTRMIYPVVLFHVAIFVPPIKYLVMENLGVSYWGKVLPPLIVLYTLFGFGLWYWKTFCRVGEMRERVDTFLIYFPRLGPLLKDMALARVFWSLGTQLEAGIDAVTAARNAAESAGNRFIRRQLIWAVSVLNSGKGFKEFFVFSGLLDTEQLGVIDVGEQAGQLPGSLARMVIRMDADNSMRFSKLSRALGVVVYFIVMGIVVFSLLSFWFDYYG